MTTSPHMVYVKSLGLMGLLLEQFAEGLVLVSIPITNTFEVFRAVDETDIDSYIR